MRRKWMISVAAVLHDGQNVQGFVMKGSPQLSRTELFARRSATRLGAILYYLFVWDCSGYKDFSAVLLHD